MIANSNPSKLSLDIYSEACFPECPLEASLFRQVHSNLFVDTEEAIHMSVSFQPSMKSVDVLI